MKSDADRSLVFGVLADLLEGALTRETVGLHCGWGTYPRCAERDDPRDVFYVALFGTEGGFEARRTRLAAWGDSFGFTKELAVEVKLFVDRGSSGNTWKLMRGRMEATVLWLREASS